MKKRIELMKANALMMGMVFILLFFFMGFSSAAIAHNVVGGVYAEGFTIEGEAGFSNGSMANAGTVVKVSDTSGTPLGEAVTDGEGYFVFTAKKRITHVFEINMGAGHLLKMQLPAEELPDSLDDEIATTASSNAAVSTSGITQTSDSNGQVVNTNQAMNNQTVIQKQIQNQITPLMLEKAIAKQIKPLRREISALKEKSGLRDIIGGIGYIFGLLGLVAFLRERKLKAKK
ncbi:cobalt ABC transporter permease [Psychromonas sp. L1A2]|uniref:cobalt ABC transporter permease n=1 Tax=Psychromonas sp. L1A2 TaxID=2686356 RepID=UPI00135ABC1B|nr:cobalt ABC transporter permease [Psychromonas sp. L1A2]